MDSKSRRNPIPWLCLFTALFLMTYAKHNYDDFSEKDFVSTKKNLLVRLKVSLKQNDIGDAAVYGAPCNQQLYDLKIRRMYDGSLTIFEASDLLLEWLENLKMITKKDRANPMRRDTCGANHLMGCFPDSPGSNHSSCKCLNEGGGKFSNYALMRPIEYIDPNNASAKFTECRVTEGGQCNVRGYLFCDNITQCVNDYTNYDQPIVFPRGKVVKDFRDSNTTRCICKPPQDKSFYINSDPDEGDPNNTHGIQVIQIPKNECYTRTLKRPRAYQ